VDEGIDNLEIEVLGNIIAITELEEDEP